MSRRNKRRILLIEDDVWLGALEASELQECGFSVHHAHNALDAIAVVDEFRPEVIVADVLLAGSTIFALLHELQSYHDTAVVPVILCTNLADQFSSNDLTAYGVRRVLDKSVMQPGDIAAAVRSVIDDGPLADSSEAIGEARL